MTPLARATQEEFETGELAERRTNERKILQSRSECEVEWTASEDKVDGYEAISQIESYERPPFELRSGQVRLTSLAGRSGDLPFTAAQPYISHMTPHLRSIKPPINCWMSIP